MLPIEPEKQKLAAALEALEAEQKRRIAEKVASGELRREVLPPAVVSSAQDADEVTAAIEVRTAAKLREGIHLEPMAFPSGDGDNSEPITCIITGVPRNREPDPWREPAEAREPQYQTASDKEREARLAEARTRPDMSWEPQEPVTWHKFTTTVRNPSGEANDYGQVDENLYSIQRGTLCVKDMEGRPIGTYQLHDGDEILVAARRIVREKRGHGAFYDPLPPSTRRTA